MVGAAMVLAERSRSAAGVLESLRARRAEAGKGSLALDLGLPAERDVAKEGGLGSLLLPGAVIELEALPGAGALTLAFQLLAEMRTRALAQGRPAWLCAIDPSRTLHAPAVAALLSRHGEGGLAHLVVLQPPSARLLRTAVRAQRCGAFTAILVDASGESDLSHLVTGVRRLTLATEETGALGVIVTSSRARRGLPLPVAARALVESVHEDLHVRFLKHRQGRVQPVAIAR